MRNNRAGVIELAEEAISLSIGDERKGRSKESVMLGDLLGGDWRPRTTGAGSRSLDQTGKRARR
jgi:hypothetical protein